MLHGRKGLRFGSRVREMVMGLKKHFLIETFIPTTKFQMSFRRAIKPCLSENLPAAFVMVSSGCLGKEAGLGQVPKRAL